MSLPQSCLRRQREAASGDPVRVGGSGRGQYVEHCAAVRFGTGRRIGVGLATHMSPEARPPVFTKSPLRQDRSWADARIHPTLRTEVAASTQDGVQRYGRRNL